MPSGTKYLDSGKMEKKMALSVFFDGRIEQNVYKNGVIEK